EHTKGILDLAQAPFGVRQRYYGKETKAAGMTSGKIGRVFAHSACHLRRLLWVSEPNTGESKGENSRRDALLVHCGNRLLRSPTPPRGILTAARCENPITIFRDIKGWDEVMMHVNQTSLRRYR